MTHVLITRPEPDASDTAARIIALGHRPLLAPLFELSLKTGPTIAAATLSATILTSRNAIGACPETLFDKPAFAVGPATTARAIEAGFRDVRNADSNADALIDLIRRTLSPASGTLFLPTTAGQGTHVAGALRASGFRVLRRIAYLIKPVPAFPEEVIDKLQSGQVRSALFFSTEAANHFVKLSIAAGLVHATGNVEAVSISERSIVALRRLPWRRISVAAKPNQEAMLALLT